MEWLESFNPRARANPCPTVGFSPNGMAREFQSSSTSEPVPDKYDHNAVIKRYLFQSSSTSEPVPDLTNTPRISRKRFQSSSTSEPVPDILDFEIALSSFVSILEHERTRARHTANGLVRSITSFQSSSTSEPVPDQKRRGFRRRSLRFNPRARANPCPTAIRGQSLPSCLFVSILEHERTRARHGTCGFFLVLHCVSILEHERTRARPRWRNRCPA